MRMKRREARVILGQIIIQRELYYMQQQQNMIFFMLTAVRCTKWSSFEGILVLFEIDNSFVITLKFIFFRKTESGFGTGFPIPSIGTSSWLPEGHRACLSPLLYKSYTTLVMIGQSSVIYFHYSNYFMKYFFRTIKNQL